MSATFTQNQEYADMYPLVVQIRDIIKGQPFVKAKRELYLPHPSSVDEKSAEQRERYRHYLAGAEFDDFTSVTQRVMLGRMKLNDMMFEPDDSVSYLVEDVDKDGLSMQGLAESCVNNVLAVKWHLLLTDYQGMSDLGLVDKSVADIKRENPRSTIKQYARENVIDWDFERINGAMQLTYLLLMETGFDLNQDTGQRENVYSYLKLGIDEVGYYQQKTSSTVKTETPTGFGEKNYVSVNKSNLQFIPAVICCDEEIPSGKMPMELGYLSSLGDLAMYRYRVSAKYKEAMDALVPTVHVMGVNDNDWGVFKEVNKRDYMASGAFSPNIWPNPETKIQIIESSASLQQFVDFFNDNKEKVKALGGVFTSEATVQRTATEIIAESETSNAILMPIADNVESSLKWCVGYCAMFEGAVNPDNVASYVQDVDLSIPKEFGMTRLSVEEAKALLDYHLAGVLGKEELLKQLVAGGWSESSVEDLIAQLDEGI